MFLRSVFENRDATEVLVRHADRWRGLGAEPGEWLAIVVGFMHRRGVEAEVAGAAREVGPDGLQFLAACCFPPKPCQMAASLVVQSSP